MITNQAREVSDHKPVLGNLFKYDVFLNHRGPDLKKTFVSHLAAALRRAGRDPFLDAKSLVKGQHALNSINEALIGVHVHIAIFSPKYAESKYCLNELCDMLGSQKPLIPVFYNVEPEDMRWIENGPFAKAFEEHVKKGRNEDVVRWRAALSQAASITGFRLIDCDNDTVKLEEEIVAAVLNVLPAPLPLPVARHPVGLNDPAAYVIEGLHKVGDNVGIVGIYGMGGIGKTTLAREVYSREQSSFGSRCFLKDVKDAKGVDVVDLQMKMVTDLLHLDVKKKNWDFARWFGEIQKQKILLVVDDISMRQQFDDLIPDLTKLAPGSRILVTSRERDILRSIMMDMSEGILYPMPELSFSDSLDLFLWCAFRRSSIVEVDPSFHEWVEEITRACCGLPLALEVMGGFLADKKDVPNDEIYWREASSALRKNGDIITSLRISYDRLANDDDKHMFLDIACFIAGHPKKVAMEVWESSGDYGSVNWSLNRLIDKCLVKVDIDNNLRMHDLLCNMGCHIVMEKASYRVEMQSHIWDPSMATRIFQKKQGSSKLLALSVLGVDRDIACRAELYVKLVGLRYLLMDGFEVNGDFSRWSEELRWLQWRCCPHREIPWNLELPNLAVLDLADSEWLTRVWCWDFELKFSLGKLRVLILRHCRKLVELPRNLNKLLKLRYLNLRGCVSLTVLPESLGDLIELEFLDVSYCLNLTSFPNSATNLLKLKEIHVNDCPKLRKLPTEFGRLESLGIFDASHSGLIELSETFGQLRSLKEADFYCCKQLQSLCEDFGCLGNLQKLSLGNCWSLFELPVSFSHLSNLEDLDLRECEKLQGLPDSFGRLGKLKVLDLGCTGLKELPEGFGQLQSLKEADFYGCSELQNLCEDFGCLSNLQTLGLGNCRSLIELPKSLSKLSSLQDLNLHGCGKLQGLPDSFGRLGKLKVLDLGCTGVKELPEGFGQLQSLKEADFCGCIELQNLCEDFGCLGSLEKLSLECCSKLFEFPKSFLQLSNLENLNLHGCGKLRGLPDSFGRLGKLKVLDLVCIRWKVLPKGFEQFQSLKEVDLCGCKDLQNLCEDFGCLGNLQKLSLGNCWSLIELPESFSRLSNLEYLILSWCCQLQELPDSFGKLGKLKVLHLGWTGLKDLPKGFGQLHMLKEAYFNGCKELQNLCANFGCLGNLKKLNLQDCNSLIHLPESISQLSNLEDLDLRGCKQFQGLPDCFGKLRNIQK